ncbi:MAG: hypothetical protein WC695_04305 [Candidatus Omnitrophota bacterium]
MARIIGILAALTIMLTTPLSSVSALTKTDSMLEALDKNLETKSSGFNIKRPIFDPELFEKRDPFKNLLRPDVDKSQPVKVDLKNSKDELRKIISELSVQGVIWGGSLKQAIVNDKVVQQGDMINNARILEITKEGIVILYMNRQFTLNAPAVDFEDRLKDETKKDSKKKY